MSNIRIQKSITIAISKINFNKKSIFKIYKISHLERFQNFSRCIVN